MSDVTRPVKAGCGIRRAEERLLALLFDTLVEARPTPAQWQTVTEIDNAMLSAEFLHFTGEVIPTNAPPLQRTRIGRSCPLIGWSRIFSICTPTCAAEKARFR